MNKNLLIYLSILLTFCLACSNDSTEEDKSGDTDFTITVDAVCPNFVRFEALPSEGNTTWQWSINGDRLTETKSSFMHYFSEKGSYEITLMETRDGKKAVKAKTVTISQNSYYHSQGESLWWNDEFDGSQINAAYWNHDQGTGIWGNNEWQTYTNKSDNSFIREGKLILKAIKTGAGQKIGDYTSARLTTRGKKEISRGRVEVRAKLGGGTGLWPAIWMFGNKAAPYYSELDIMEYVGCDKDIIYGAIHTTETLEGSRKISGSRKVQGVENNFHVYGMNWTDGKIEFYLDTPESIYLTFTAEDTSNPRIWPFNKELYLILNIAVGGDWGGMRGVDDGIFPREMEVDYIRIFTKNK